MPMGKCPGKAGIHAATTHASIPFISPKTLQNNTNGSWIYLLGMCLKFGNFWPYLLGFRLKLLKQSTLTQAGLYQVNLIRVEVTNGHTRVQRVVWLGGMLERVPCGVNVLVLTHRSEQLVKWSLWVYPYHRFLVPG